MKYFSSKKRKHASLECITQRNNMLHVHAETTMSTTSAKELKLRFEAIGSIRAFICSQASKTTAPYISELAEAAVGVELGT